MASSPIASWQIKRENVEVVTDFLFLGSKITADDECSHEIRRRLLLGRKAVINLDSVLKSRHYSADKGPYSQGYHILSGHIWLWELDCKEAECQRTDVFKLWCWRRLLRVPWTARSNQSILREINSEYSLEGLMLKLKLHYFGHLRWTADSWGKLPDAGKDWGQKEKRQQRMRWLDSIIDSMDVNLGKLQEMVRDREDWRTAAHGIAKSQTWLGNWTIV